MRTFKEGEEEMSLSYPFLQIPFIDDAVVEEQSMDEEILEMQPQSSAREERGRKEEIGNVVGEKLTNDVEEESQKEERKEEKRGDEEKGRLDPGRSTKKKRWGNSEEEEEERVNGDELQKREILWENENQGEGVNCKGEDNEEKVVAHQQRNRKEKRSSISSEGTIVEDLVLSGAHQQRKIPRVDTWCSPSISKSPSAPLHQQPASSAAMSSACNLSATKIARSSSSPWLREHNRWFHYTGCFLATLVALHFTPVSN